MAGELPLIRMEQGATELSVPSTCFIDIESGGYINVDGYLDVNSGGYISVDDGGYIALPVVADSSAATLANFGVSTLTNGSSAPTTFTLDAPGAGRLKTVKCDVTFGTSAIGYLDAGSGVTINSTQRYMSVKEAYAYVTLIGLSATAWAIVGKSTGVTLSTGSTT